MESPTNQMKDFMKSSYGDDKLDKSNQLSHDMSIVPTGNDEYNNRIANINATGGGGTK